MFEQDKPQKETIDFEEVMKAMLKGNNKNPVET